MTYEYRCLSCEYEWTVMTAGPVVCPQCAHHYVKWVNYDKLFGEGPEGEEDKTHG